MKARCLVCALLIAFALPARADWRATTPAAAAAVKTPRIAAALEAVDRFDQAILSKDKAAFADLFADNAVVNNPFNKVATKQDAITNMEAGLIDYTSLRRSIEYAAPRGKHEVVLMGEETLTPVGKARFANKRVVRRTTEVWSNESGSWQLAIRQATIYSAE